MELEVRLIKKNFNAWCVENNLNEKNKRTPLLFLKNKVTHQSPTENVKKGNKIKNETLETIDKMLENINDVFVKTTKENEEIIFNYTLNLDEKKEEDNNKITNKDYDNFIKLCDLICELYGVHTSNYKLLLKNLDLFNSLLANTLGNEGIYDKLTDIVAKADLALLILETNKEEE